MKIKDAGLFIPNDPMMVEWTDRYITGIPLIDNQHKELIRLTNALFEACLKGDDTAHGVFKEAMRGVVEYVRYHFGEEEKLLERIDYPELSGHRKKHESLVRDVLDAAKNYGEGKKYVPNNFARTLRDWILTHIAMVDREYAFYIADQKKQGLLTDQQINGLAEK